MKLAFVTLNDSTDVHQWSGLNYHIARSLEGAGATLHRVGPLATQWSVGMRVRQRWYDATGRSFHAVIEPSSLRALGKQARASIPADADAVVAVTSLVAAAIGPLRQPLISWDDATNASMHHFYPDFQRMPARSIRHSRALGFQAAHATALALYASEWAAASAMEAYELPPERVAVVPFGANLSRLPLAADVEQSIAGRPSDVCRLLWVGVDWVRKGGPLTLEIAQEMRARGVNVELTIVGCDPALLPELPVWTRAEGYISKRSAEGEARLGALFARSHFFVMPSSAEAYGLVYAEAAAYGVPSVAMAVGGVPTVIVDGVTGLLEAAGADAASYASRMVAVLRDEDGYRTLARSARARAEEVLNWEVAGKRALGLIEGVVKQKRQLTASS